MIYSRTILAVSDNSGATYVKALTLTGGVKRQYGRLYDAILIVPKKIKRRSKNNKNLIQKRKKYLAVIMATKTNTRRRDGGFIKFLSSTATIFGLNGKMVGNAIRMPLCRELRHKSSVADLKKLASLSRQVI